MWPNPQETADLVTFTEEILDGKRHFFLVEDKFFDTIAWCRFFFGNLLY